MRRSALLTAAAVTLVSIGCAPAEEAGDTPATTDSEPRVAAMPTATGTMPAAITGGGGALQGTDFGYFDQDPAAMGYLAVPEGPGPFPSLIIIHEWNGLVDRVREVADAFAAEGYVTLAADLYSGRTGSSRDENIALLQEARGDMPTLLANLNSAAAYLRGRDDTTGRVGAMGWCFGGGVALTYALEGDDHEATAIFYGALSDDPEVLSTMTHEVYGSFGQLDSGPSPEQVEAFETALDAAGIEHDLHVYDGVGHAFWLRVDDDPEARAEPATDAWDRLKAYLDRTLGG